MDQQRKGQDDLVSNKEQHQQDPKREQAFKNASPENMSGAKNAKEKDHDSQHKGGVQNSAGNQHKGDAQNSAGNQQQKKEGSKQQQQGPQHKDQGRQDKDKNDGPDSHRGGSGQRQDDN